MSSSSSADQTLGKAEPATRASQPGATGPRDVPASTNQPSASQPSASQPSASQPSMGRESGGESEQLRSWAWIGRRWSTWATNLLGTGLVIVLGLAMGRQLVQWWAVPGASEVQGKVQGEVQGAAGAAHGRQASNRSLTSATIGGEHDLSFDVSTIALRHGSHQGDEATLLAELRRQCAGAAQSAKPEDLLGTVADDAERRLLERLRGQSPVAGNDEWSLYELARPLPMVVVVSAGGRAGAVRETVFESRRVLSWGLGLPSVSDPREPRWTWFAWRTGKTLTAPGQSGGKSAVAAAGMTTASVESADWPRLQGARRVMSLRSLDGVALAGYVATDSTATPRAWREQVDAWLGSGKSAGGGDWVVQRGRSQRVFVKPGVGRFVVQIVESSGEALQGFITLLPQPGGASP